MAKLTLWQSDWDEADRQWEARAHAAATRYPLKNLKNLPQMIGVTAETAKNLKWKSLKWMVQKDDDGGIRRSFFKHPWKYGYNLLRSALRSKSYVRDGDFFLYGVDSQEQLAAAIQDPSSLLILGFSYCHKPFECPAGRFTPECIRDDNNVVCQQCFIGKAMQALTPCNSIKLIIPTIHYIGNKIFEIVHNHPCRSIVFMITACELTLKMFGDWGNMTEIRGVGIRLAGRICNTMEAFELSERGIKPGLTVVLDHTQQTFLKLIRLRNQAIDSLSEK